MLRWWMPFLSEVRQQAGDVRLFRSVRITGADETIYLQENESRVFGGDWPSEGMAEVRGIELALKMT